MAQKYISLLKQTFSEWSEDGAPRLGAALSYYTVFSLAPLLVLVTAVAAVFFGQEAVSGHLDETLRGMMGQAGAKAVEDMVASAARQDQGIVATIFGIVLLLLGASGVFGELQSALNTIWEVKPKPNQGIWAIIRQRFFSITMVMGTCFLLLVSLVVSTALTAAGNYLAGALPGGEALWTVVNAVISFGIVALMFALIFKYVPDVKSAWSDVWIGAVFTAALFVLGKWAIAMYLGRTSVSSSYGAAGSLAIVLLWVYYVAQIVFFGAEFTQVYANQYGSRVVPAENAQPLTEEKREEAGIPHERPQEAAAQRSGRAAAASKRTESRVEPDDRKKTPTEN
ncbi:MAG TPA: YihY/virulence factor BrkB family protein [Planctomycetota bacterium]|nr:YihY/virulence factor BrkB family protein [Planctomycetota bacterium]